MSDDKENKDNESLVQSVDIDMGGEEQKQEDTTSSTEEVSEIPEQSEDSASAAPAEEETADEKSVEEFDPEGQELFDAYDGDISMDVPAAASKRKKLSSYVGGVAIVLALAATGYVYLSSSSTPSVPDYEEKHIQSKANESATMSDTVDAVSDDSLLETGVLNNIDNISQMVERDVDETEQQTQNIDFGQPPLPLPMSGDADESENIEPSQMVDSILNDVVEEEAENIQLSDTNSIEIAPSSMALDETESVDIDFSESSDSAMESEELAVPEVDSDENTASLPMPDDIENLEEKATVIETNDTVDSVSETISSEAPTLPSESITEEVETPTGSTQEVDTEESVKAIKKETSEDEPTIQESVDTMDESASIQEDSMEEVSVPETPDTVSVDNDTSAQSDSNVVEVSATKEASEELSLQPEPEPEPQSSEVETSAVESVQKAKPVQKPAGIEPAPSASSRWVLRSAQLGVAWVSRVDGSGDLVRIAEGQKHPDLGTIKRIAPINGHWVIEGTNGKIEQ